MDRITKIADHYGIEHQLEKTLEEIRELKEEISNYLFDYKMELDQSVIPIIDEVADVKIMIAQLEYLLKIKEDVDERIDFKLKRQLERMREEDEVSKMRK